MWLFSRTRQVTSERVANSMFGRDLACPREQNKPKTQTKPDWKPTNSMQKVTTLATFFSDSASSGRSPGKRSKNPSSKKMSQSKPRSRKTPVHIVKRLDTLSKNASNSKNLILKTDTNRFVSWVFASAVCNRVTQHAGARKLVVNAKEATTVYCMTRPENALKLERRQEAQRRRTRRSTW